MSERADEKTILVLAISFSSFSSQRLKPFLPQALLSLAIKINLDFFLFFFK